MAAAAILNLFFCPFLSNGLYPVAALYITGQFHLSTSIGGWIIAVCAYIQDGGHAILNKLWAINEIQNGGRRHFQFIIFIYFGQIIYIRWQQFTLLQNFIHLRQSAAELLLFVHKSKTAAATKLNYNFVMLDYPRSPVVLLKIPFKFRVDRVCTFRDIAIRKKFADLA